MIDRARRLFWILLLLLIGASSFFPGVRCAETDDSSHAPPQQKDRGQGLLVPPWSTEILSLNVDLPYPPKNGLPVAGALPGSVASDDTDDPRPIDLPVQKAFINVEGSAVDRIGTPKDVQANDIWQRIRRGFKIPHYISPLVAERLNWYLKHKNYLEQVLSRAKPYLHYILEEIEKRNSPSELALLPIIESGFNPFATSVAHATGLWQFIPSTGHIYRLKQDWWIDERRDIVASTKAALDYLNGLHKEFNNWHLALIAYNWGEAHLSHALLKNQHRHLSTYPAHLSMPREARYYIPQLEAIKTIILNPEKYNVRLPDIANQAYLVVIETQEKLDVATAARLADLSLSDFLQLNPAYQRPVIHLSHRSSLLLLPVNHAEQFQKNLALYKNDHTNQLSAWKMYHVAYHTSPEYLAHKFNIKRKNLLLANGLSQNTRFVTGDVLVPRTFYATLAWYHQEKLMGKGANHRTSHRNHRHKKYHTNH